MSYDIGTMVIANAGTVSTAIAADPHFRRARGIIIAAPATLTGTLTVNASVDGETSYTNLQSGGADITLAQGDSAEITQLGFTHVRVTSSAGEGAERTITCRAIERALK